MGNILAYTFDVTSVTSSDGTHPIAFPGATVTTGPGVIGDGNYPAVHP